MQTKIVCITRVRLFSSSAQVCFYNMAVIIYDSLGIMTIQE